MVRPTSQWVAGPPGACVTMAAGQHIAIRRTRAPGRASRSTRFYLDHGGSPRCCWHDDDQAGQQVVLRALTLTRQIWLLCTRRDAKA